MTGTRIALVALALTVGCGGKARSDESTEPATGGSSAAGGSVPMAGSGGTANGGRGGGGTGGVSIAGAAGVAGLAEAGAAGAPSSGTCTSDADCRLFSCCEHCEALSADERDPFSCAAIDCDGLGCGAFSALPVEALCVAGRCVTNISCDERLQVDPVVLPECVEGFAPTIEPAGTGRCMDVIECRSVSSCEVCYRGGQTCVVHEPGGLTPLGPTFHCVDIPAACNGMPTCECMGTCVNAGECSEDGFMCTEFCPNC